MDLTAVRSLHRGPHLPTWQDGDAWLAGGTYLFSEPQPDVRRLLDLTTLGWADHEWDDDGLRLGATCTIAGLQRLADSLPPRLSGLARLVTDCCRAFLAPVTVWNTATVGGNLCNALPAGPMISLTAALDGVCEVLGTDGGTRHVAVVDLVTGDGTTSLGPGELVRSVRMPAAALTERTAMRRASLTEQGRSSVLVIARRSDGGLVVTVTAATRRPVLLRFPDVPDPEALVEAVDAAVPAALWHDDVYGCPAWRRHLTLTFVEQVRAELLGEPAGERL